MPHALFLGSMMATQDRVSEALQEPLTVLPNSSQATIKSRIRQKMLKLFRIDRAERETSTKDYRSKYGERENNSLSFIREHLSHGIIDIVSSLIAIAVPINSASVFSPCCLMNCRSHADGRRLLKDSHSCCSRLLQRS